jgi:hypothetical protein
MSSHTFEIRIPAPINARLEWRPPDLGRWRRYHARMRSDLERELEEAFPDIDAEVTVLEAPRNDGRGSLLYIECEGLTAAMLAKWRDDRFLTGGEIRTRDHQGGVVALQVGATVARVLGAVFGVPGVGDAIGRLVDGAVDAVEALHRGETVSEDAAEKFGEDAGAVLAAFQALKEPEAAVEGPAEAEALEVPPEVRALALARFRGSVPS